jgi:hypothetical protein
MVIVSLSSIPPRFGFVGQTINSLLKQTIKIDAINLYLPRYYRRYPNHHFCLPQVPEGVNIITIDEDLGPASKILPAARQYRGSAAALIYCDDDRVYDRHWAHSLIKISLKRPNDCVCNVGFNLDRLGFSVPTASLKPRAVRLNRKWDLSHRYRNVSHQIKSWVARDPMELPSKRKKLWRAGYVDIMEGYGGVLVKPEFFDDAAWNIPGKLWPVDDIWLSGQAAKKGVGIWLNSDGHSWETSPATTIESIKKAKINGMGRRDTNRACVSYMQERYGIWT